MRGAERAELARSVGGRAIATRGRSSSTFQLGELDRAGAHARPRTSELAATRQVLASAERVERLCAESYASLYESDDAVLATLGGVWRRVGRAGRARSAVPAVPRRARRHQVAARGSRAVPAPLRRRHRGVAGAAPAGRGAAGAARTAEAQVRADARRRHRAARRAAARARPTSSSGDERHRRARARATTRPATRYLAAAAALSAARRAAAATFRARSSNALLASWRWSARGSRSGSTPSRCRSRRGRAARHRRGRVLRLAESRRGAPAAGAHRLRRRAVAHHAGDQDADRDVAARLQRGRRPAAERRPRPG